MHVCRFQKGPNLASLKGPVIVVEDPDTKTASVAHLSMRENLLAKRKLIEARISHPSTVKIDKLSQVKYTCRFGRGLKVTPLKS